MLINTNQVRAYIDRRGHGDKEFSFGSQKSCYGTSINFGQNTSNIILMNPLRTTGSIIPQTTSMESGTGIGRNRNVRHNRGEGIPPRNIGGFGFFDIGILYLSRRIASLNGA